MKLRSSRFADPGMRHAAGLTLVEILVTLAIAALLMTLAVPSFKPVLERWRVKQSVGALTDTLRLARSEAIKRGGNVAIQKLANNTNGCTLAAAAADWGCGWQVFVDSDADGSFSANEELLQLVQIPANIQVRHSGGTASIAVDRWGKMDGLGAKSFVVAPFPDGNASPATRTLCISSGARIHEEEGAACRS
ncbi:GspH/FimT family pseudopilin [Comamonas endophytica]|uniref:Type II secretion system protein H n=1 Tax=Comamonas endophytica TaxID=2949090 RepID=A0ABY6GBE8_9BURK|nr:MULTISPECIES: GspH/FimT family pseudopilin [unclassified Acidovorax]MCD2513580.1 GspH/FimT family pseudopilin [Acidovorax sp. D4N7]UYG52411.1 GspH/FimT family pseudopilin [Acidovorax sp. 5MLIR]